MHAAAFDQACVYPPCNHRCYQHEFPLPTAKSRRDLFLEFAVLVENVVFVLRLLLLVSMLTACIYAISPADPQRDSLEQRIESGVFAFGAAVGLLILQIM